MSPQHAKIIDDKWHMDRGIPVAFIFSVIIAILGQTVTAVWFASKLDMRVDALEAARVTSAPQGDRLTRVEVKIENIQLGITEIKDYLRTSANNNNINNIRKDQP